MRHAREFRYFLETGTVKKQTPDFSRAKFLAKSSKKSYAFLRSIFKKIELDDNNANSIVKLGYDIIMELIRAKMLKDGYNSKGLGAHEAEVAYLRLLGFGENEVQFANKLRYFRNGILYYGKILDKEYAEKVTGFVNKAYPELTSLVD